MPQRNQRFIKLFLLGLREFFAYNRLVFHRIMNLAADTDYIGTIKGIKDGVVLEGSNLWILICSTIIACIGLDTNSPAVIIGAMLISPLMSPILGIGLSMGINDREYLIKSGRNFMVAIGLSLLVAVIYFKVSPFGELTDEMKARTAPTILDAFVAFFGGLAGIIAGSRTDKTNAIPGVAIATALMPPLCTAGYGIATLQFNVFGGAFYLFFINAVLISLSTYAIVRMLHFPHVETPDEEKSVRSKRWGIVILVLLLIPSIVYLFASVKRITERKLIENFISSYIHGDLNKGVQWSEKRDTLNVLNLKVYYFGTYITEDSVRQLESNLIEEYDESIVLAMTAPKKAVLELIPTDSPPDQEQAQMKQQLVIFNSKMTILQQRFDAELKKSNLALVNQLSANDSLQKSLVFLQNDSIPFHEISKTAKVIFPELKSLSVGKISTSDFSEKQPKQTVLATFRWDYNQPQYIKERKRNRKRLQRFLEAKTKVKVRMVEDQSVD
ncbi:TIGR00341 family protein [Persicobacter psychrovividus]|uniref:DUF389 domain-containing protein n=1 Tax=Persicobacter psychrovividus TaxID=387638 RepID=A0ABN6LI74_9BACT|nr:DUF389 domain-containing protein [Persicobacter psychrovividus]